MSDIEVSQREVTNRKAITSLVLALLSIVFSVIPFLGLALAIVGIAFGIIGLKEIKRYNQKGKVIAVIGIICSALIILSLISGYMLFLNLNVS